MLFVGIIAVKIERPMLTMAAGRITLVGDRLRNRVGKSTNDSWGCDINAPPPDLHLGYSQGFSGVI
jgi:hypothetical protein